MGKEKYWIVDFQHTDGEVIKTRSTCVTGRNISEALVNACSRIARYMMNGAADPDKETVFITSAGIADDAAREHLDEVWPDPINDPDPELFK